LYSNSFEAILEKEEHLKKNLLYDFKDDKSIKFLSEIKILYSMSIKMQEIYIKDNGIGIKAAKSGKIFRLFLRQNRQADQVQG
jgi:light-regulated signal transduction histidine kinase (bacteriophytochrome)